MVEIKAREIFEEAPRGHSILSFPVRMVLGGIPTGASAVERHDEWRGVYPSKESVMLMPVSYVGREDKT